MAAPFFATPFQPYVYQSSQAATTAFQILGGESQIVQIMLKPNEKFIAKPGTVCYMSGSIQMDNNYTPENEAGFWLWLFGKIIKSIVLSNPGQDDEFVGIAAPSPSRILPEIVEERFGESTSTRSKFSSQTQSQDKEIKKTNALASSCLHQGVNKTINPMLFRISSAKGAWDVLLTNYNPSDRLDKFWWGDSLPDAFLCSANEVRVTDTVDQRPHNLDVSSKVILKQKLVGQGLAFLVGCGSVVQKILSPGEALTVDAACIVAMTSTINFQLKYSDPTRRVIFGMQADNQLMATLSGPGVVLIQSLPFQRLSQRIAKAVAAPSLRDNPKLLMQMALLFFLAYVVILSSLMLTDF